MTRRSYYKGHQPDLEIPGDSVFFSLSSDNSPRYRGKLVLRPNSLSQSRVHNITSAPAKYRFYNNTSVGYYGYTDHDAFILDVLRKSSPPVVLADLIKENRDLSDSKLRSELGSASMNLAEMWATRKQTIDMFTSTISRFAHAYRSLKRRDVKSAMAHLGLDYRRKQHRHLRNMSAPQAWLELQYGWKPLIGDVWTAIDHPWDIVTGEVAKRSKSSRRGANSFKGNPLAGQHDTNAFLQAQITGQSKIKCTFSGSAYDAASRFGLTNGALLAWELLPYSFVVDWALPIGDYLEGLTLYSGMSFSEYSYTYRLERRYSLSANYSRVIPNRGTAIRSTQVGSSYIIQKNRILSGFELHPLPKLKNPFSLNHMANALSLLATAFDRK